MDYEKYMEVWSEAEEHRVWEKVPYDAPFGTKEEMLHQLAVEDDKGAQRYMRVQSIAARAKRVRLQGRSNANGNRGDEYLTARIARDAPDVLERMEGT